MAPHLYVNSGRVDAAVTQQVRDLIDRAPLPHELSGQAMTHQMRAGDAGSSRPPRSSADRTILEMMLLPSMGRMGGTCCRKTRGLPFLGLALIT